MQPQKTITRITKHAFSLNDFGLNNYSYEFTSTKTTAGGTLRYIVNHRLHRCCNDLNIYENMNRNQLSLKLSTLKSQTSSWESLTGIHPWVTLTLIAVT